MFPSQWYSMEWWYKVNFLFNLKFIFYIFWSGAKKHEENEEAFIKWQQEMENEEINDNFEETLKGELKNNQPKKKGLFFNK